MRIGSKFVAAATLAAIVLLTAGWLFTYVYPKVTLFDPDQVRTNLAHMDQIFPAGTITAPLVSRPLPKAVTPLPEILSLPDGPLPLSRFLSDRATTSLTVVRHGVVVGEFFDDHYDSDSRPTSFSVAKAFVSTLIGVALHKGWIAQVQDPVTRYLPELAGTGWDGVTIEQLLNMSSGTGFTEVYDDTSSDAYQVFDGLFVFLQSIDDLAAGYPRASMPGTVFHYASINTHILSMILRRVADKSLTSLMKDELWEPLGAEGDALWLTDLHGKEIGFWGLGARPVDYAKLGLLMLNDGVVDGRRILPEGWVRAAIGRPGIGRERGAIDGVWGYQYQWWLPAPTDATDYSAIGIWGQFIYVNPELDTVIVKTSADPDFKAHEFATIALFRALALHYASRDHSMNAI